LAKILFWFLGFMVYILFNVGACARKSNGWHGGEATLKNGELSMNYQTTKTTQ